MDGNDTYLNFYFYIYIYKKPDIGIMVIVFADGPGDWGSIPGQVIPKTKKKKVLDASLLNTQYYKVQIKGKVEQSRERSNVLHLGVVAIEKEDLGSPSTTVANFTHSHKLMTIYLGFSVVLWLMG